MMSYCDRWLKNRTEESLIFLVPAKCEKHPLQFLKEDIRVWQNELIVKALRFESLKNYCRYWFIYVYSCLHLFMYIYMYVCMYACMHVCLCIYIYVYLCLYIYRL